MTHTTAPPTPAETWFWTTLGPQTEEQAAATNQTIAVGNFIGQPFIDTWHQIATAFQQTHDPELRKNAAIHIGATKRDYDDAARITDRTIRYDVSYGLGLTLRPIINNLIATADADQLRHVIHGMTTGFDE